MANENLKQVLGEIGLELRTYLKERIQADGGVATGEMLNSIDYEVSETADEITLYLISTEYFKWWDQGTLDHWPPRDAIKKWIEAKPVVPEERNGKLPTVDQLAFLISRKIAGKSPNGLPGGTPSHEALKAVADSLIELYQEKLANAIMQDAIDDALGGENVVIDIKI